MHDLHESTPVDLQQEFFARYDGMCQFVDGLFDDLESLHADTHVPEGRRIDISDCLSRPCYDVMQRVRSL